MSRPLNLVLAILYTLVNISNLAGEGWAYYILFGIAENAITVLIFLTAWKWPIVSRAREWPPRIDVRQRLCCPCSSPLVYPEGRA